MAYIRGTTEQLRQWNMGSFYWAGLKEGDWYSMTKKSGAGSNIKLEIVNQSGVDRMQYSWTDTVEATPPVQEPFDDKTNITQNSLNIAAPQKYSVFDMQGSYLGSIVAKPQQISANIKTLVKNKGIYLVKNARGLSTKVRIAN